MEWVELVDEQDNSRGIMEKLSAHKTACLHRAISVFVFNRKGEMLLQKRAATKYHSASLWTNACCTHPRPSEDTEAAAHRRLKEEMGLQCDLEYRFPFLYKAEVDGGLIEHEYDHVFFGISDATPSINPAEVSEWQYRGRHQLEQLINTEPELFTAWFRLIFDKVKVCWP